MRPGYQVQRHCHCQAFVLLSLCSMEKKYKNALVHARCEVSRISISPDSST